MKLIINPHNVFSLSGKCYRRPWQTFASCDMQMAPYKYSTFRTQEGRGSSNEAAVCVYDY